MAVRSARGLKLSDHVAEDVVVPELGAGLAAHDLRGGSADANLSAVPRLLDCAAFRPCQQFFLVQPDIRGRLQFRRQIPSARAEYRGRALSDPRQRLFQRLDRRKPNGERCRANSRVVRSRAVPLFSPYSLQAARGAWTMRACVINRSDEPLPCGLGFHPWIVRTPDTRLKAVAETVLLESADNLPAGAEPYLLVANGTSGRCATFRAVGSRCAPVVLFTRALTSSHARRLFLCLEEIRIRGPRLVNEMRRRCDCIAANARGRSSAAIASTIA